MINYSRGGSEVWRTAYSSIYRNACTRQFTNKKEKQGTDGIGQKFKSDITEVLIGWHLLWTKIGVINRFYCNFCRNIFFTIRSLSSKLKLLKNSRIYERFCRLTKKKKIMLTLKFRQIEWVSWNVISQLRWKISADSLYRT